VDLKFENLVDHKRIVAIDATPIPAPPGSEYPGEHLFVNCHYAPSPATGPPHELLDAARADVLQIVSRLTSVPSIHDFVSAVVTVYGHFPVAGAARPARRRIYRLNILCNKLPVNGTAVTPEFFSQVEAVESSELDDVAELLHEAAT
jgi:hypothetical protein